MEKLQIADQALKALRDLLDKDNHNKIERDAAINRFKISFEACWKAAKQFLSDIEGVDAGSPKGVIRSCREVDIFSDEETKLALKMVNDRNLTVYSYDEDVAMKIHRNLDSYYKLLNSWLKRMVEKTE